MNLNDIVKQVLLNVPETRESSRLLIWEVYKLLGYVKNGYLSQASFFDKNTPHPASIIRRARTIQKEPLYQPVKKPYRRRKVVDWDFSENIDVFVWEKYK